MKRCGCFNDTKDWESDIGGGIYGVEDMVAGIGFEPMTFGL